jgi:hypothetical protein
MICGVQISRVHPRFRAMAGRFFARIPVVVTAARSSPAGAFGGVLEAVLTRKGSKNYNWYYRALEQRKVDAAAVAV